MAPASEFLQMEYTVQTGRWVLPGVEEEEEEEEEEFICQVLQAHTFYILSSAELEANAEGRELRQ